MAENVPSPSELWHQSIAEHPRGSRAQKDRYRELAREHGLTVPRKEGDDPNLPCGWPGLSVLDRAVATVKDIDDNGIPNTEDKP